MKPKNVIVWILLLGIVALLMSTSVQAKELTEVNASDILEKIVNGEDVYLENVCIIGELNLSKIKLETVPNAQSAEDILCYVINAAYTVYKKTPEGLRVYDEGIMVYDLEKKLKVVESNIIIRNSIFEEDVDFSSTKFRKYINFVGTSFSSKAIFRDANFAGDADFWAADFAGDAYFTFADFAGDADFWAADFAGDADFRAADFAGDAYFGYADFAGNAKFWFANFAGDVIFRAANFAGDAKFWFANFAGYAIFRDANFAGYADFWAADFASAAKFKYADFAGDAYFGYADFAGDAYFWFANFAGDADFRAANFAGDAYFDDANFTDDATFFYTKFHKVSFTKTIFTNVSLIGTDFDQMIVEWSTLKDVLVFDGLSYIKIIKNFREMEQFEDADAATYQYRRLRQANKKWSFSKLMDVVSRASCGYGVKPWNAAALAVVIILIFIPIYGLRGGIRRSKENDEKDEEDVSSRRKTWNAFVDAFYFSMVTFTTIGYGDLYPADRYRKVAVMIEGLFGWLILALFIVTLANVMIRP